MSAYVYYSDTLYHHGIKGQRWGIRRFQNEDGSYTEEGKKRYQLGKDSNISVKRGDKNTSIFFKIDNENEIQLDMKDKDFRKITEEAEKSAVKTLNDLGLLKMSYEELLRDSSSMHPDDIDKLNELLDYYMDYSYSSLIEESLKKHYSK